MTTAYPIYARLLIALTLTLSPLFAAAQLTNTEKITTQVPFEFMIAGKALPAGKWIVQKANDNGSILKVSNGDANVTLLSLASPVETDGTASPDCALVFHRYGNRYFLWGMTIEGSRIIYRLPEGKLEKELRAQIGPATDKILVSSLR
jgi:hypothetical protein